MGNSEKLISEPHKGEHKSVPDLGEIMLDVDIFAPEDIHPHLGQQLPETNLKVIYDVLELDYVKERRIQRLQSATQNALAHLNPKNLEEYAKPDTKQSPLSLVRNEGRGGFVSIRRSRRDPAA